MSHVNVKVNYDGNSRQITFSGDNVLRLQNGLRAAIGVPNVDEEKKIVLKLSGDGATYPDADQAVIWQAGSPPSWIGEVKLNSSTELQIDDWWQEGDEPRAAKFTLQVQDKHGDPHTSDDPTIVNDPPNNNSPALFRILRRQ